MPRSSKEIKTYQILFIPSIHAISFLINSLKEMSQGETVPSSVLHWLTTRPYKNEPDDNEFYSIVLRLEDNDWKGVDENGEAIVWDDLNMENCSRGKTVEIDGGFCSDNKRQELIARDLSLMHVYFKETHIRKYLKQQNFGWVDAIGNFVYNIYF